MRRSAVWWAAALILGLGIALEGCASKDIRQEGGVTSSSGGGPAAAQGGAGVSGAGVSERNLGGPGAGGAASSGAAAGSASGRPEGARAAEPPPAQTAAVERAAESAVAGGGLAAETTSGLARVHFDFDQSALTAEAREILSKNAKYMAQKPGAQVRIEGHCDERGTTEYNLALGERRGNAAKQYLADLGVDPNRMTVVSYGKEVPLDPGHSEEAWAKNRRAEFVELQK